MRTTTFAGARSILNSPAHSHYGLPCGALNGAGRSLLAGLPSRMEQRAEEAALNAAADLLLGRRAAPVDLGRGRIVELRPEHFNWSTPR